MSAPTATSLKAELLALEKEYWDAMAKGDAETLGRLTADRFVMVMEEGAMDATRAEMVDMLIANDMRLMAYELDESSVIARELAPGVAVLAYKGHSEMERAGKPESMDYVYSTTWVKTATGWVGAAGAASPAASTP